MPFWPRNMPAWSGLASGAEIIILSCQEGIQSSTDDPSHPQGPLRRAWPGLVPPPVRSSPTSMCVLGAVIEKTVLMGEQRQEGLHRLAIVRGVLSSRISRRQEGSIVIIGVLDSESLRACRRMKNKLTA